jgi:hypothetical protein
MTEQAISPFRRRMIEDMTIHQLGAKNRHGYVHRSRTSQRFWPITRQARGTASALTAANSLIVPCRSNGPDGERGQSASRCSAAN